MGGGMDRDRNDHFAPPTPRRVLIETVRQNDVLTIPKGEYGEFSKLEEEWLEIAEAREACDWPAMLGEMADFLGAMEKYLRNHFASEATTMESLLLSARRKVNRKDREKGLT